MKNQTIALCAALAMTGGAYAADYGSTAATAAADRVSSHSAKESQTFSKSKDLIGADIKDSQGNKLGDISELYVNPKNGETFASIGLSGSRHALVPIQAFTVTRPAGMVRNAEVTLNKSKQELESGPLISKDEWNKLDQPEFVQSIYSHYNIQPGAMGGSDTGAMESGSGSSGVMKHNKQHDKTTEDTGASSTQ